jgi:hypothetical protein
MYDAPLAAMLRRLNKEGNLPDLLRVRQRLVLVQDERLPGFDRAAGRLVMNITDIESHADPDDSWSGDAQPRHIIAWTRFCRTIQQLFWLEFLPSADRHTSLEALGAVAGLKQIASDLNMEYEDD